ncbi:MAG: ATP-dependent DNA helicase Rep, partial [Candidatus Accumulibacter sp.]|nr:ATP-dependent DNA helicase Rep [Accumulibacter sp.]
RLMYVGVTRAQRSLHLSYCEKRRQGRELIPCRSSRFIDELGRADLRFSGGGEPGPPDRSLSAERFAGLKAILNKQAG